MAMTVPPTHTGAHEALQEAHGCHYPEIGRHTSAGGKDDVKTMADHAQERRGYRTRWQISGDLAFGRTRGWSPTRHDKVRAAALPLVLKQS